MRVLIIGNPENRRVRFFIEAIEQNGQSAIVLPYAHLLSDFSLFEKHLVNCTHLKIESFGENDDVINSLLKRSNCPDFSSNQKASSGVVMDNRSIQEGFKYLLSFIDSVLESYPSVFVLNTPLSIIQMMDKYKTHQVLAEASLSTTKLIGHIESFDELKALLECSKQKRVFIKPSFSSSASGVLALQYSGNKWMLQTSTKLEYEGNKPCLYNSLKLSKYNDLESIKAIVNALSTQQLIVEQWMPKASFNGEVFDLRVVVVNDCAEFVVMRSSKSPITNLHLGNRRGDIDALKKQLGLSFWSDIQNLAIQAVRSFKNCSVAGVDILINRSKSKAMVIEVNPFGDLMPNVLNKASRSTYEEQVHFLMS